MILRAKKNLAYLCECRHASKIFLFGWLYCNQLYTFCTVPSENTLLLCYCRRNVTTIYAIFKDVPVKIGAVGVLLNRGSEGINGRGILPIEVLNVSVSLPGVLHGCAQARESTSKKPEKKRRKRYRTPTKQDQAEYCFQRVSFFIK